MGKLAKSGNSLGEKLLQEHLLYSKQLTESMDRWNTLIDTCGYRLTNPVGHHATDTNKDKSSCFDRSYKLDK